MTTVSDGAPVTAGRVVRTAFTIYRRRLVLLAVMSLIVFSILAVAESIVETVAERRTAAGVADVGLWVVTGLWTFGSAVFSGLCDTIVGTELGRDTPPLRQAWKRLPYARLIALDIVVTAIVTVGMALLIVPGVVAFTLTCIAAPLVLLEDRGVRASMTRSAQLIRPRFALALVVVTVPVLIEHEVIHAIEAVVDLPFAALLTLNVAGIVLVLAPVTLCEVVLAHALIGAPIEPVPVRSPRSG